jgi:hypothetical protein
MIDLGSFLASYKSKIFLPIRETATPFKPPNRSGNIPPDLSFDLGAVPKKVKASRVSFEQTYFSQKK